MYRYAQTNIQLYEQLLDAGYSDSDLRCVRAAYELMCALFSAQFRPNGKPVIAHLVGVASALAAHGAALPVVLAGLSHAAYATGDFGGFWPRMTRAKPKRRRVSGVIGEEAEAILAHYTAFAWNERAASLAAALPDLSPRERDVILVRLANELDEAADHALIYGQPAGQRKRLERLCASIHIARGLGLQGMAEELEEAHEHLSTRSASPALLNESSKDYTTPAFVLHEASDTSHIARTKGALVETARRFANPVPELDTY